MKLEQLTILLVIFIFVAVLGLGFLLGQSKCGRDDDPIPPSMTGYDIDR